MADIHNNNGHDSELAALYEGLSRVTGLSPDTEFGRELIPINLCYAKWCLGSHDTRINQQAGHPLRGQCSEQYIRQSIPPEFDLPVPQEHPDHEGSDSYPCKCDNANAKRQAHYHCPCGQMIMHTFIVYHRVDKDINAIIGSCCIKRFMPTGLSRRCNHCNAPHANRKNNLCSTCRQLPTCTDCAAIGVELCTGCVDTRLEKMAENWAAQEGIEIVDVVKQFKDHLAEEAAKKAAKAAEDAAKEAEALRVIATRRENSQCIDCGRRVGAPHEKCFTCARPFTCLDCPARICGKWNRCYPCSRRFYH